MDNLSYKKSIQLDVVGLFLAGLNNTVLALLVAVFIHGPGTTANEPELILRATFIAENAGLWKAGWLFWFLPTLSFSWSYHALGRHLDASRPWRDLAIGLAVIAAAVDVVGIFVNFTILPELANALISTPDPALQTLFGTMEKFANTLTNVGGFGLYSLAGILLLPAVFATSDFYRPLAWLGVFEWGISIVATILLVIAPAVAIIPLVISFLFYAPWVWGSALWLMRRKPTPA